MGNWADWAILIVWVIIPILFVIVFLIATFIQGTINKKNGRPWDSGMGTGLGG